MKYKCLVFDHDDTTVNSTANVHYPSFCAFIKKVRPELHFTLEEYIKYNFNPGILSFFKDICGLSDKEAQDEQDFWMEYTRKHVSKAFDGIKEIMLRHKENGGLIAVVSHSFKDNILRDYEYNDLPIPDIIFGWDEPKEERKPSPTSIYKIMDNYKLDKSDILVIDDLKPGLDMARSAGVDFLGSGWCYDIKENTEYMKKHADYFCKTVKELEEIVK